MEGVGARLGRSSTRYGPTTVFTGPVRKWKKKWIHVSPPASSNYHTPASNGHSNGNGGGGGGSHLLLYKWTPISQSQNNGNSNGNGHVKDDDAAAADETEEPPRRKLKYIPVAVLEEQKTDDAEPTDDDVKPSETDTDTAEPTSKNDEKPDINDIPMEENQDSEDTPGPRQDLNESLDLSLG